MWICTQEKLGFVDRNATLIVVASISLPGTKQKKKEGPDVSLVCDPCVSICSKILNICDICELYAL